MALTQISTAGVKDDAVTAGKIPANAVGSSELADNAVDTAAIADDAVTAAKIANDTVTAVQLAAGAADVNVILNGAVVTSKLADNAVTTAKIADQAVTLDKLPHGTSSNNGKFLRANNGADPTFETVSIPAGTTINNNADNRVITGSGTANTLEGEANLTWDATTLKVEAATPALEISGTNSNGGNSSLHFNANANHWVLEADNYTQQNLFSIKSGTTASSTARLSIDANGDVGIGTTNPFANLEVMDTSTNIPQIRIETSDGGSKRLDLKVENSDGVISCEQSAQELHLKSTSNTTFTTASTERMRIDTSGNVTSKKPVKTIQDTVVTDTSGARFEITLPSTSRMFRITGSFKFDGTGAGASYRIWGDLGSWSDSHTPNLEGFANFWVNGASGDLEQDVTSNQYFEVADPVDPSNCEVTYDILLTTQAFNGSNGGQRPGVSGNISWTYSQIGRAWTVFSYQDISASGTDRLTKWAWDIDGVSGSHGTGTHQYVVEEYPLTAQ